MNPPIPIWDANTGSKTNDCDKIGVLKPVFRRVMHNDHEQITIRLIQRAQRGDQESRTRLLAQSKVRAYTYLCRLTMNEHLAEDLCQETLMTLLEALPRLQFANEKKYWAWIYRSALGKAQHHYRVQGNKRITHNMHVDTETLKHLAASPDAGPEKGLWRQEMVQVILKAMSVLTSEYRTVITLRCFEELSYAQISTILGGSQMRSKLLFYRAKKALRHELSRRGLKRSHFFGALAVFSSLTAHLSQQSAKAGLVTGSTGKAVTLASLEVGWGTTLLGTLSSKYALIGSALVLTSLGTVSIVRTQNANPASETTRSLSQQNAPAPVPRITLGLAFDDPRQGYTPQSQIADSYDPDNSAWQYFPYWPRFEAARPIQAITDQPQGTMLVLGADHWVEYGLTNRLREHTGPEIVIQLWNWGELPSFELTNGDQKRIPIFPTSFGGQYPRGSKVLGFDLNNLNINFTVSGIRITGRDNAGPFQGCGIGPMTAFVVK